MKRRLLNFVLFTVILSLNAISQTQDKITYDVYYFHATIRCESCNLIEELAKSSIHSKFGKQIEAGFSTFTSIDFLQPENEHYQSTYQFESQTLILSKKVNGQEVEWINLDKIWDYLGKPDKFKKYVQKEVKEFMNNKNKRKK